MTMKMFPPKVSSRSHEGRLYLFCQEYFTDRHLAGHACAVYVCKSQARHISDAQVTNFLDIDILSTDQCGKKENLMYNIKQT